MKIFIRYLSLTVALQAGLFLQAFKVDDHLKEFIFNTTAVNTKEKDLKADISFLFIDFKYNAQAKDRIKICEFGRAKTAGLGDTPLTMSIDGKETTMFTPFWPAYWLYLEQFNLPVWWVGIKPADHKTGRLNETESNYSWDTFLDMGGKYQPTLEALENDQYFKHVKYFNTLNPSSIKTHKGIIIYKPRANATADYEEFKAKYPQFIYADEVTSKYGGYKHIGASLFEEPSLKQYKPRCKSYTKKYTKTLAKHIINDIGSDVFVIKPVAAGYGRGVIMVTKQELDETLKHICKEDSNIKIPSNSYEKQSKTYAHWKYDQNSLFMVEEYCPATPLFIHDKFYDPTVRVYFTLRHDAGTIYVNIFGGYYKIPVKALDEEGTLTEKHKTVPYYKSSVPLSAITLPEDVLAAIVKDLQVALPKIYHKMLENHKAKKSAQ